MESQHIEACKISFEAIHNADSPDRLRQARIDTQHRLLEIRAEASTEAWLKQVNEMHDAISVKAVQLCEQGMVEDGFGPPPVPYAFIAFGSMGRSESTPWSDQDNGMIISDEADEGKEAYFSSFGSRLSDMLEWLGYRKCEGKVMCSEPLWRQETVAWKKQLEEWSSDYNWDSIRHLIIASDMRHIAGDEGLSRQWKEFFSAVFRRDPGLAGAVLRNTVKHKATLNILGQIVTERFGEHAGDFDIKYGCYIPLVNSVRFMALQNGVTETSTLRRLKKLASLEAAPFPLLDSCQRAFLIALHFRNSTPCEEEEGFLVSSGYMPVQQLKQRELWYELRESLTVVRRVHRALQRQLRFMERRKL
ncbi:DUF294 nucleotidyltransferase-like domain-containing protein [Paenibacillus enshidis]|uniref:DUF294 nucleotidyltransferase-like domain-containing protein n=1 Tax=Paenibacillus enshidis TaxID=1458439 RepID=A0ABV5AQA0_9BACL